MRIVDLLKKEAVVLNADVSEKEQMLDLLVDLHKKVGNIEDKEAFKAGIMKRESEGPTAIAEGICIPHSKNDAVIKPGISICQPQFDKCLNRFVTINIYNHPSKIKYNVFNHDI